MFSVQASATPQLPSKTYRPKQSLGQNYLKDPNTVAKIVRAFHADASPHYPDGVVSRIIELGPGAGALTDKLVESYGESTVTAIEIDPRSVELLKDKHSGLDVRLQDVLQVDYLDVMLEMEPDHQPLTVIGNLPYYITSQIMFALADASHEGAIASATVTMQYEVARRVVAQPNTKDYGILSVVFQLYSLPKLHFKIPPTVFYPKPKVDSALVCLRFATPHELQERLKGVSPADLRRVVTTAFQQRRKILRNSLRKLVSELKDAGDEDSVWTADDVDALPADWSCRRPEQLTPDQFVALTRHIFGAPYLDSFAASRPAWPSKVWRKLKHGSNTYVDDEQ
jgi:ribosomal RNA small subunit methyltransferase A